MTTTTEPRVVIVDMVGLLATDGETAFYLTPCHRAAVTGSATGPGVECKECRAWVDTRLAESWPITETSRWVRWVHDNLAADYAKHPDNRTSGIPEGMYASALRQFGVLA